jgi:hypothetical protein
MKRIATISFLILSAVLTFPPILRSKAVYEVPGTVTQTPILAPVASQDARNAQSLWEGYSALERVCSCESWGDPNREPREYNSSGTILWGNDPKTGKPVVRDEGACQINTYVWQSKANELGDDLTTLTGNVAFAKWLFAQYGLAPWKPSESCWKR